MGWRDKIRLLATEIQLSGIRTPEDEQIYKITDPKRTTPLTREEEQILKERMDAAKDGREIDE